MTDYGVTNEGFVLKRLADIKADTITALSTVIDPESGEALTPDLTDEDDPLIQAVNAICDELSVAWENLQLAFNQFDPLKATGAGLSGTVQLNGLRRTAGSYSVTTVTLTGTPGVSLVSGKQITDSANTHVWTLPAAVIGIGGTVSVLATCTEKGPFAALAGTLTKILTPVSGWSAVTNSSPAVIGSYEETDTELRIRQQASTSNTGFTAVEAIASGVLSLPEVDFCKVYQNVTLTTDARGIPAKTIAPVVIGGNNADIADIMFQKIAGGGCDTHGDIEIPKYDSLGVEYIMRFSRPTGIPVYVEIDITVVNESTYPSNAPAEIISAIVNWATLGAYPLGITSGYDQNGYNPGQSVYASELYVPANSVPGFKINSITVSMDDSTLQDESTPSDGSQVTIEWNEIASFASERIIITEN